LDGPQHHNFDNRNAYEHGEWPSESPPSRSNVETGSTHYAGRNDAVIGSGSTHYAGRNDAVVGPIPNTVLRQNVTQRRSQGRAKDRVSLGETSVPVESLLARKPQPREKDVEYQVDAQMRTPPQYSVASSIRVVDVHPNQGESAQKISAIQQLWIKKSNIEGEMQEALNDEDEKTYHYLEAEYNAIQCQISDTLCVPTSSARPSGITPGSHRNQGADTHVVDEGYQQSSGGMKPDWHYNGSSYVIYLQTHDTVIPWVVWANMPVSLLVQAAVSILTCSRKIVTAASIVLVHEGIILDAVHGCLSDSPVLADDVVTVQVTVPRGGIVFDRNQFVDHGAKKIQPSKPRPTIDPPLPVMGGRPNGGNRSNGRGGEVSPMDGINVAYADMRERREDSGMDNRSYEKIKQTFKCPKFSGQTKDWKQWDKGFQWYLSIWDLEHVLDPDFFDEMPLSKSKLTDNKLVFYILEDATQGSSLAASYVRQSPAKNGFEAYYTLHDGFVFAGSTASTILLNELSNFRFKQNETPTELIMRLEELFQDLEMLPSDAALSFNDTQKIGYLLGALRHESQRATVASTITSEQLKGKTSFRQACEELKVRCEADKAYSMIDKQTINKKKVHGLKVKVAADEIPDELSSEIDDNQDVKALISSMSKRLNREDKDKISKPPKKGKKGKKIYEMRKCIAKGCTSQSTFPLCGLCYHSLVSGKNPTVELEKGWGNATFSTATNGVVYPSGVPIDLIPKPKASQ
jgi:hypothetical protein